MIMVTVVKKNSVTIFSYNFQKSGASMFTVYNVFQQCLSFTAYSLPLFTAGVAITISRHIQIDITEYKQKITMK